MNVERTTGRYLVAPDIGAFVHLGPRKAVGLLLVVVTLLGANASAFAPGSFRGKARVIDADTLEVAGEKVRLLDVDAFELAQRCDGPKELAACGAIAAAALRDKVADRTVTCSGDRHGAYGRLLASCIVDGTDLSSWLVEQGYGLAFRRYSTRLVPLEEQARAGRRGFWRTTFEPPWDYRDCRWKDAAESAPDGCPIKGYVNQSGELIYHTPWGDRFYERTRIDPGKGERWFCSKQEAVEAGFRAPRHR